MRMFQRKEGMELQVNFIVTLILAIAVFIIGIDVLILIVTKLPDLIPPPPIPDMPPENKVFLAWYSHDIKTGDSWQTIVMIRNKLDTTTSFRLNVECSLAFDKGGNIICSKRTGAGCRDYCGNWFMNDPDEIIEVDYYNVKKMPFPILVNKHNNLGEKTLAGTYVLDFSVSHMDGSGQWTSYDTIHKLTINVRS